MQINSKQLSTWRSGPWRIAAWTTAAALMLVPIGIQVISGNFGWSIGDFIFVAVILVLGCLLFDWAARKASSLVYLAGAGFALAAGFGLLVVNGAVGLVGSDDEVHNLLFGAVLLVAICGSFMAQGKPGNMAKAMLGAAVTHIIISVVLLIRAGGAFDGDPRIEIIGLSVFAAMWLASAWLFRIAAPEVNGDDSNPPSSLN